MWFLAAIVMTWLLTRLAEARQKLARADDRLHTQELVIYRQQRAIATLNLQLATYDAAVLEHAAAAEWARQVRIELELEQP